MKEIYLIKVVRPAYAKVAVKAESESEARKLAIDRAHETIGFEDYVYGDFKVL